MFLLADNWIAIWTLFHYSAEATRIDRGVGADLSWSRRNRGSNIQNGDSFRPTYTGKYSITLGLSFGENSTGNIRVGLKLNGLSYNLNGIAGRDTPIVSADTANRNGNMLTGNMIVDAVARTRYKSICLCRNSEIFGGQTLISRDIILEIPNLFSNRIIWWTTFRC